MAKKSDKTAAAKATALAAAAAAATAQATSQAKAQASELGDRLAPVVDEARERLAPVVLDARDRLAPVVDDARERLVDLTGTVATRIDDLTGTVATRIDDALPDRVTPALVKGRVPAPPRPNRFRQALLVLGLGTLAAVITRRLTGGGAEPTWRSTDQTTSGTSATPAGAPATEATPSPNTAGPAAAAAAGESAHGLIAGDDHASGNVPGSASNDAGEVGPDTPPVVATVDVAGGTPEEVAADATDTPHEVTTPDRPAHKVILD